MATIFHVLPSDTFIYRIIPSLTASATYSLSRVSKAANEIVQAAAVELQEDITLSGKSLFVIPKSLSALFHQKLRVDIFTGSPELLVNIGKARVLHRVVPTDKVVDLLNESAIGPTNWSNPELALSLVPFDFDTKNIEANGKFGLGSLLIKAIHCGSIKTSELVIAILSHPNGNDINADGEFGLGKALKVAESLDEPRIVRMILSHPNAAKIPVVGLNSLGGALLGSISSNDPALVQEIVSHPNAAKIQAEGGQSIARALEDAATKKNPKLVRELVRILISHPNAANISGVAFCAGLGNLLIVALQEGSRELFEWVLSHRNAKDIPAQGPFSLEIALRVANEMNNIEAIEAISSLLKKIERS